MATKAAAIVFAILMLVFVLTSVDWNQLRTGGAVGEINGQRVDLRVYQTAVQQAIEARQRETPTPLGQDDYKAIRDQVWEQFVQNTVLETEYERHGITVTEDEIVEAMRNSPLPEFMDVPEFQTDSQFDLAKYQRWLASSVAQLYLPTLEAQYREQIQRAKLLRVVTADVYLSDAALWEQYRDRHESVKIRMAAIVPRNAVPDSAVEVTPQEMERYYREHQDEFKRPKTAFLSYVSLSRLPNAGDTAYARARADSLRQEIAGGAPFAEVATRESADSASAVKGGELDEWTRGTMDPAFDSAAFSLPLKTLSRPVLSQFGFHLIEITSRKKDKAKGRHILIPVEVAGAHRDSLDARADTLERLAAERADPAALDTAARALRLPISQANPVQEGTRALVGRLVIPDAGTWAFGAEPGSTSPVIETDWAYYVFRLDSLQPERVPPLAEIRGAIAQAVRNEKKWDAARKIARDFVQRLEGGTPMAQAAEAMKLPSKEFGPFTRVNPPLANPVVVGAAFGLDVGQRSGVLDTKDGIYVLEVLEHTTADSAKFVKELEQFRAQAINQARQERVRSYLQALREAAEIEDNRDKVLRVTPAAGV